MSRNTNLLIVLAAFAVAMTPASLAGQAREAATPNTSNRARIAPIFLPRAADEQAIMAVSKDALSGPLFVVPDPNFEAEDWGDDPKLGFIVQDMTPFGSGWSGNKQIFWNPGSYGFKWQFKAPGAKALSLDLTAAPDYGKMMIKLLCYQPKTTFVQGKAYIGLWPVETKAQMYDGYAPSVQRRSVSLFQGGICSMSGAHGYLLVLQIVPTSGRRIGGIDRIVVSKK